MHHLVVLRPKESKYPNAEDLKKQGLSFRNKKHWQEQEHV